MDSIAMVALFDTALKKEIDNFDVNNNAIRTAIQVMKEVYLPNGEWQQDSFVCLANYDDPAHRCAYLHKYAMCHTGMTYDLMDIVLQKSKFIRKQLDTKEYISLCSLGEGPGNDIVALLSVFVKYFGVFSCCATVIDYYAGWNSVFSTIIGQLQSGRYGEVQSLLSRNNFNRQYIQADLLEPFNSYVEQSVMTADFISMVKFASAAACKGTRNIVQEVFDCMKPGAMLLFIDNAAGGFLKMIQQVAQQSGMQSAFGPLTHFDYANPLFCMERFGYKSQSRTKVSLQIWIKPQSSNAYAQVHDLVDIIHCDTYEPDTRTLVSPPHRNQIIVDDEYVNNNECCTII